MTHRGRDGCSIFLQARDYRDYRDDLVQITTLAATKIHAYCLIRNEIQLLLSGVSRAGVRQLMTRLAARHVYRKYGGLELPDFMFEDRLQLRRLVKPETVLAVGCDIELASVRRMARPDFVDYPWSSFRERAQCAPRQERAAKLTWPETAYLALGDGPSARGRAYRAYVEARLSALERSVLARALGNEAALFDDVEEQEVSTFTRIPDVARIVTNAVRWVE